MMYACNPEGVRVGPTRRADCRCPLCLQPVRPKALSSEFVSPHWAHLAKECDSWSEPESAWHRGWKEQFPEECREITVGPHRADVRLPSGLVVELQHSFISAEEISERERFYGKMIWLLDATRWEIGHRYRHFMGSDQYGDNEYDRYEVEFVPLREQSLSGGQVVKFRWRRPRRSWSAAKRQLFLDLGPAVVKVGQIHWNEIVGGWGTITSTDSLQERIQGRV